MKIAISGGASQGKSTLVNALAKTERLKEFVFKTNLTRSLQTAGIPINELGTSVTQLFVMSKHYEFLSLTEDAVLDRCALDGLAYSMYFFNKIELPIQDVIRRLFQAMIFRYDKIFYIVPELPLVEDGQRSTSKQFFDIVNNNFETLIRDYKINVIRISGSVEERIEQVLKNL
jgi:nicotinamide riboside kinase